MEHFVLFIEFCVVIDQLQKNLVGSLYNLEIKYVAGNYFLSIIPISKIFIIRHSML